MRELELRELVLRKLKCGSSTAEAEMRELVLRKLKCGSWTAEKAGTERRKLNCGG
jgi:hypothetical protein